MTKLLESAWLDYRSGNDPPKDAFFAGAWAAVAILLDPYTPGDPIEKLNREIMRYQGKPPGHALPPRPAGQQALQATKKG